MTAITAPCGAIVVLGKKDDSQAAKDALLADHKIDCPRCPT